ncbi:DUF2218 domain-containing protein [Raineyella sp. W15-4]|uniref:DUF2218 domain-containing protein n=1 Tax=Raineyella sp. W15-4 TaxID=3081651 RepID=UPI002952A313|nr:DUF2218 domain-containing protein [Raineyella sp. W15-4]WOQ18596.1 DUF2218 domain-containing protein [Raineyella sp. W15-4]
MTDLILTTATVATDRAARYGKQLVSHLTRRAAGDWDVESATGHLDFGEGRAELSCRPDALVIELTASPDAVERLQDVVARHLVRFGARDELVVDWGRPTRATEEPES